MAYSLKSLIPVRNIKLVVLTAYRVNLVVIELSCGNITKRETFQKSAIERKVYLAGVHHWSRYKTGNVNKLNRFGIVKRMKDFFCIYSREMKF